MMFSLIVSFTVSILTQLSQVETGHISYKTAICYFLLRRTGGPWVTFLPDPFITGCQMSALCSAWFLPQEGKEGCHQGPHEHPASGSFMTLIFTAQPALSGPSFLCRGHTGICDLPHLLVPCAVYQRPWRSLTIFFSVTAANSR